VTAWAAYPDGSYPPGSGLRVLERTADGNQQQTRYSVCLLCCDSITELSHAQIRERSKKHTAQCAECYRRHRDEREAAIAKAAESTPAPPPLLDFNHWPRALIFDPYQCTAKAEHQRARTLGLKSTHY
jgi:hypothetical protein